MRIRKALVAAICSVGLLAGPALAHNTAPFIGTSVAGFPKTIYARTPGGTTVAQASVDVRRSGSQYAFKVNGLTDTYADGSNYCAVLMFKTQSGGVPSYFRKCTGTGWHDLTDAQNTPVNTGVEVGVCQAYRNGSGYWDNYNCSASFWWGPNGGYADNLNDGGIINATNEHWL